MRSSFKLLAVRGIDLRLHITFPLVLILAAFQFGALTGSAAGGVFGVVAVTILFVLVTLHELGHSIAAQRFGIEVKQIVLSPIGGVAQLAEMPEDPRQELVIAAAGPAVNFAAAFIMAVFAIAAGMGVPSVGAMLPNLGSGSLFAELLEYVFAANLFLALFNLLPAFPLDGGRILRALLAMRLEYAQATKMAANVGRIAAILLGIYGLLNGGIMLVLIAVFIFSAATQEQRYVQYSRVLRGYRVEHAVQRNAFVLRPDQTVRQAADLMHLRGQTDFAITDGGVMLGYLSRERLLHGLRTVPAYTPVAAVMDRNVRPVGPQDELLDVERRLAMKRLTALPVVDGGQYIGLISAQQIAAFRQLVRQSTATPLRTRVVEG